MPQEVQQCSNEVQAPLLVRQVAYATDAYELRRILNVLNTPRSCKRHDRFCVVERAYVRGLIMLKAARDIRRHEWMLGRIDSLHNALSLFNEALSRIKSAMNNPSTSYEERCTLGLVERDVTFEAMVVISMLETVWHISVSASDTPDVKVLFSPNIRDIHKAATCGFPLQSHKLPPLRIPV